jgi:membrane protein insertase Oxa1/YidC/SpoIIIJ
MSAYTIGLLIIGVPVIIWLIIRAIRKMRDITVRIREVREELATNPQAAAQGMAEIIAREQFSKKPKKHKDQ